MKYSKSKEELKRTQEKDIDLAIKQFKKGNTNLEQHKGYQKIINTPIPEKQTQDSNVVIIDPTTPHTPLGYAVWTWGIGSSVLNNAITSGTPGVLEAGKHNNLPTKTNHHPSTSVDNSHVTPNLSVKQQSSAKSSKTLHAITKIAKQVKALNQDEQSSSYSEENEQQPIIRVERSVRDDPYAEIRLGDGRKILVVRTRELDIDEIIRLIKKVPGIDKLDILPFTINDQKTKDLITELSKHNIHNITFVKDTSLFYHKHYPPLKPVSDNSTFKDILGDNLLETSATPESHTTPEETVSKEGILWRIVGGVSALALSGFGVYALYKKFFGNEKVGKSPDSNQTAELELRDSPPPPYDDNDPTYEAINPTNVYIVSTPIYVSNDGDAPSPFANAAAGIGNSCYNVESTNIPVRSSPSQEVTTRTNISDINDGYDTVGSAYYIDGAQELQGVTTCITLTSNIPNTNNSGEYEIPICKPIYVNLITKAPQEEAIHILGAAGTNDYGDDTYIV